ncbi:MAG: hypothetical protein ACTSV7_14855 [Candidatus Baldrarchaeia archaeon]
MRRIILLVLVAVFLATAFSFKVKGETVWCEPSVAHMGYEERIEKGIFTTSFNKDCVCYPEDYLYKGDWRDLYCLPEGKLKQARVVKVKVKPSCDEWEWKTEEREIEADFCKKCPDPNILTSWKLVGCEDNTKIYKRNIEAYFFNPTLTACFKQNYVEFKFEKVDSCEGIKDSPYIWYKITEKNGRKILPEPQPEGFPIPPFAIAVVLIVGIFLIYYLLTGGKRWLLGKARM